MSDGFGSARVDTTYDASAARRARRAMRAQVDRVVDWDGLVLGRRPLTGWEVV